MTRLARFAPQLARLGVAQARRNAERTPEACSAEFDKELSQPDRELHAARLPNAGTNRQAARQPAFRAGLRGRVREIAEPTKGLMRALMVRGDSK